MIRYSDELLDEIKSKNDIIDIVSEYVVLKRSGRNYMGLCPFHKEKSGSFCVSPDKQIFHCFGCGVGGNVFRFVQKIENVDFKEAVELLANRVNVELPINSTSDADDRRERLKRRVYEVNKVAAEFYHQNLYLPTAKMGQEYVKKRKLDNRTLKTFKIGYSGKFNELYLELKKQGFSDEEILATGLVNRNDDGKFIDRYRNRLMFPIFDSRDRVIAFGGRVLDDSKPKYINSPENIVYSKGRHLFGLNIAKKESAKKILIVEGYMDVISLHQRGIKNVVGALGTALTEQQGWLLRKTTEQVILGFDADGAGQNAIARSMEILQNMGCDMRVLQIEGAKDPDEYIIKYGEGRFKLEIENAISLVEFKVRNLKKEYNLENSGDKINFLREISKILSKVESTIEREIYIEKIAKGYNISKEAIYAEVNKLIYTNFKTEKTSENQIKNIRQEEKTREEIDKDLENRENTIIALLLDTNINVFKKIQEKIKPEDFKVEINKKIAKEIYKESEKSERNINKLIDTFDDEMKNHITMVMATDYEFEDMEKAVDDVLQKYEKEKLNQKKKSILKQLETEQDELEKKKLGKELSDIIISLAKIK